MLLWYTFKLSTDDNVGYGKAFELIRSILIISNGGMSGVSLFHKDNRLTKERVFFVSLQKTMDTEKELINRNFPLSECERPTGQELERDMSGNNLFDDYKGLCKEVF